MINDWYHIEQYGCSFTIYNLSFTINTYPMKRLLLAALCCLLFFKSFCWGFYAHQKINYYATFLLPPEMLVLYKPNIDFISEHAVDPDKRRYISKDEAPRHFIDIDHYGPYP